MLNLLCNISLMLVALLLHLQPSLCHCCSLKVLRHQNHIPSFHCYIVFWAITKPNRLILKPVIEFLICNEFNIKSFNLNRTANGIFRFNSKNRLITWHKEYMKSYCSIHFCHSNTDCSYINPVCNMYPSKLQFISNHSHKIYHS